MPAAKWEGFGQSSGEPDLLTRAKTAIGERRVEEILAQVKPRPVHFPTIETPHIRPISVSEGGHSMPTLNFDPGIRAPTARDFESTALELGRTIGGLPDVFRKAQESQFDWQRKQALQNLFPSGLPMTPDGQVDYSAIVQKLAPLDPAGALKLAPELEQQIYQKQIEGGGAPGAGAARVPGPAAEGSVAAQVGQYAQTYGPQFGVAPDLLNRIAYNESGFNPNSVSPKGATGVFQFMSGTAQDYGLRDRRDVRDSTRAAAQYLGDLKTRYSGNEGLMAAAYNWGEANVDAWLRRGGDPRQMPLETRNYVSRVTGSPIQSWRTGDVYRPTGAPAPRDTRVAGAPPITTSYGALAFAGPPAWPTENRGATAVEPTAAPPTAIAQAAPTRQGALTADALLRSAAAGSPNAYVAQGFSALPASAGAVLPAPGTPPAAPGVPVEARPVQTTRERPLIEAPPTPGYRPDQWREAAARYEQLAAQPNLNRYQAQYWENLAKRVRAAHEPFAMRQGEILLDPQTGERIGAAGAALSGPALEAAAQVFADTGKLPPNLGRGAQGREDTDNIIAAATVLERQRGGDPSRWSEKWQSYKSAQTGLTRFTSGRQGDTVRSFNVLVDHLSVLTDATTALQNKDVNAFNYLRQAIARQLGSSAPTDFNGVKALVGDEIVKAVVGSSGALADREEVKKDLSEARSEKQLLDLIQRYRQLAVGQLHGLRKEYESATGRRDFNDMLLPGTREYFERGAGSRIESGPAPPVGGGEWTTLPSGARYRKVQ
jgi:soluble lytic murein transglycosylase-like protein